AEDGIRDFHVTGVQTCALPISAIAASLVAAVGWGAWHYGAPLLKTPPPVQTAQVATLPEDPTIAILPLANLSGDPAQDYFSDGRSEERRVGKGGRVRCAGGGGE